MDLSGTEARQRNGRTCSFRVSLSVMYIVVFIIVVAIYVRFHRNILVRARVSAHAARGFQVHRLLISIVGFPLVGRRFCFSDLVQLVYWRDVYGVILSVLEISFLGALSSRCSCKLARRRISEKLSSRHRKGLVCRMWR